ncbi:hypothetical protein [Paenimyroides aestuarii]|uniref:Uncharacterized protein n=1 Tax=Paenimyroides aestuarii TaxID=2968490 RepID=A0ABY5NQU5_9FLAO|nr:hypothetical protein [Paenimyroides aestuarii]UUV20854.1 hypothetical protein NPX36_11065 [Paenimyroides aestuarii]
MSNKKKHFRLIFILSIFILLLNDHFLKDYFGNYFTGKLSDFSGLFAFPYFLCLLFPSKINFNYIVTGLFFIFWKSEFIEPLLHSFHLIGIGLNRTVDYSDLIALSVLPFSYLYWYSNWNDYINFHKALKPMVLVVCAFSFVATSMPKQYGNLNLKTNLEVRLKANKQDVISILNLSKNKKNYDFEFKLSEYNATINAIVKVDRLENGLISIKLDSILDFDVRGGLFVGVDEDDVDYIKNLNSRDFEKFFVENELPKIFQNKNESK